MNENPIKQLELKLDGVPDETSAPLADSQTNVISFSDAVAVFRETQRAAAVRRIISLTEEVKEG